MRRVSMVSFIAAGIVMGHVLPHWLASRFHTPEPPTRQSVFGARAAPSAEPASPLVAPICELQPPLNDGAAHREFVHRFEICGVDVRELDRDVLVSTPSGGPWSGARFRKTPHGWIALQMDGGQIE
jgi:hypothetical protein